jgi:hypothetical protein
MYEVNPMIGKRKFTPQDLLSILASAPGGLDGNFPHINNTLQTMSQMGLVVPQGGMVADNSTTSRPTSRPMGGAGALGQIEKAEGMDDLFKSIIGGSPATGEAAPTPTPPQKSNRSTEDQMFFMQNGYWPSDRKYR